MCPMHSWSFVLPGKGAGKAFSGFLICMVYMGLTIEHRDNKHIGIVYSKSLMFNPRTYFWERIYSRIIRIGVIICQANLFI